jgi:hypothetical protein
LVLVAGDPARPVVGRGVRASLLLAGVFVVFAWTAKEVPALYVHVPWQDDPYDALISATIFFVPALAGLCLVRAPLCRRAEPLPARRALDLLRAGRVLVGAVLVTLAGDWVSVALGAHRNAWTSATLALTGVLALLTAASIAVAAQLERARRSLPADSDVPAEPDWLADAGTLSERLAAWVGQHRRGAGQALSRLERDMLARIQRQPVWSAAFASLAFGAGITASQAIGEGYRARAALLFLAVSTSSMFAFLLTAGAHLRLAGTRGTAKDRILRAVVAGCVSVWLTYAFRSALLSALGIPPRHTLSIVSGLALMAALAAGTAVLAAGSVVRWHARMAQRRRHGSNRNDASAR